MSPSSVNLTSFTDMTSLKKDKFSLPPTPPPHPIRQSVIPPLGDQSVCFCSNLVTGSDSNISLHGIQQSVSGNDLSHTAWLMAISKYVHLFQNTKVNPFKLIFPPPENITENWDQWKTSFRGRHLVTRDTTTRAPSVAMEINDSLLSWRSICPVFWQHWSS